MQIWRAGVFTVYEKGFGRGTAQRRQGRLLLIGLSVVEVDIEFFRRRMGGLRLMRAFWLRCGIAEATARLGPEDGRGGVAFRRHVVQGLEDLQIFCSHTRFEFFFAVFAEFLDGYSVNIGDL